MARRLLVRCRLMVGDGNAALAEAMHPSLIKDMESALATARDMSARGAHQQAITLLKKLEQAHPRNYTCLMALADALQMAQHTSEALECARQAQVVQPDASRPKLIQAAGLIEHGEIRAGLALFENLLLAGKMDAVAEQGYLIALHYDLQQDPSTIYAAHENWAKRHVHAFGPTFRARPSKAESLRIGWISPRFNEGPVARFLTGLLVAFDHENHQHVLAALHPLRDGQTEILENNAHETVAVHDLDDDTLLERLRALQLDVIVDLAGHAPFSRPRVLAQRVAPIQLSWLDWFDTTGLPNMDGWISDPWLSPPGSSQRFSERLLYLRSGRFCYTPPDCAPEPSRASNGPPKFVSFNRIAKLNDVVIQTWARILDASPASRLLIGAGDLNDAGARASLLKRFAACGIHSSRLQLQGHRDYSGLLEDYRQADIALDPFPFSGCTTSCDALWMGVPVITMPGWSVASRQTASLLWRLRRREWVARDTDDYVARAIALANKTSALRQQRAIMREQVRVRLCDATTQATEFAQLLRQLVVECGAKRATKMS